MFTIVLNTGNHSSSTDTTAYLVMIISYDRFHVFPAHLSVTLLFKENLIQ